MRAIPFHQKTKRGQPVKILFMCVMYDYNDKRRGIGGEWENFYRIMQRIPGVEISSFDCSDFSDLKLREENNARLLQVIKDTSPDVLFYISFKDIISRETLQYIKNNTKTTTINWFCDDHWNFDRFSKDWCWNFDYCVTTYKEAVPKYQAIGYKNIILSQWAASPETYPKLDLPLKYDVSFVGQRYGERQDIVNEIRAAGIQVACFGYGWNENWFKRKWNKRFKRYPSLQFAKRGISCEEMVRVFNQSRINLNFSASSVENMPDQIKLRNFEVACCGGFLLTGKAPHLEDFFEIGKEIVCYDSTKDMIDKIKYYLAHEDERQKIALAGYNRTIKDHTYARFKDIFSRIKLKS